MSNLWIGIKRFFKNKNTVTILAIVACLLILYFAYSTRIKRATEPQRVPYALVNIEPRTEITEDMVGIRSVPGSVITPNVITTTDSIIGYYVSNKVQIPADSLFYKDTILTWDELPTSIYGDIPDGWTIFYLPVDLDLTYGNSIFEGNYIDLYFNGYDEDNKILIGKFIESIKVLAVTDSYYNSVFEKTTSDTTPSFLLFAVPDDYYLLLHKTLVVAGNGSLIPVPRNADYSLNPKETAIASTYIQRLIESRTVNITEEDLRNRINNQRNGTNGGGN